MAPWRFQGRQIGTDAELTGGDVVFDHVPLLLSLEADRVHAVLAADITGVQPVILLADRFSSLLVELLELGLVCREEVPVVAELPVLWPCEHRDVEECVSQRLRGERRRLDLKAADGRVDALSENKIWWHEIGVRPNRCHRPFQSQERMHIAHHSVH